jgi:hypothetical protein
VVAEVEVEVVEVEEVEEVEVEVEAVAAEKRRVWRQPLRLKGREVTSSTKL